MKSTGTALSDFLLNGFISLIRIVFRHFMSHVQELSKMKELMEIWLDSFDSFCRATSLLSEGFKQFHSTSPYATNNALDQVDRDHDADSPNKFPFATAARSLDEISLCIDERIRPAVISVFHNRCIKPVSSILSMVPGLQESHQIRKSLLSEFDSYRLKMEKEFAVGRDSSHPNVMRKAAKLDESAKKLHSVQSNLFQKFYEFEVARSQTLGPEMGVFAACMHSFSSTLHSELSELVSFIPQSASTLASLDAMKLSSVNSTKLQVRANNIPKVGVDVISARPISAGGCVGGYGTVVVQDYHLATSWSPSDSGKLGAHDESVSDAMTLLSAEPSIATSMSEPPLEPPSRPVSELSVSTDFTPSYPPSFAPSGTFSAVESRPISEIPGDFEPNSRPISDITMHSFASAPDSESIPIRPPKPPRKQRPASSSSRVDHLESLKESADEDLSIASAPENPDDFSQPADDSRTADDDVPLELPEADEGP
jgi:hypothetical protein